MKTLLLLAMNACATTTQEPVRMVLDVVQLVTDMQPKRCVWPGDPNDYSRAAELSRETYMRRCGK